MSGLLGIYHFSEKYPDKQVLVRMADALAHRGPDGIDTWQAGPVGLGHCMLWTTPESLHEHLPLTSDDGTLTITADARIDNRDELISALNLHQQEDIIPDSSLILFAYQRWGESCVDHLLGDFAFAIWDAHTQHLFCARDHMGVKPFYYYRSDKLFAFASEIKALFCVPGIPREVNEKGLAFRLAGIDDDPAITSYLHIHRLPAAHTITVSSSEMRIPRYWSLDPHKEIHFGTDEEFENAFRTLFTEAVQCRLRSAFPIGSELSGGLDSSSVVCVARHLLHQEKKDHTVRALHTFSAVFDEVPECDERTWINYVLAGGDLTSHFIYPEQISPLYAMEHQIRHIEEPTLSPTSYTYWTIFQTAKDIGVRVVLSGEWGDVIVSYGKGTLLEFASAGKLLRTFREIISLSKNFGEQKREIISRDLLVPLLPHAIRQRYDRTSLSIHWIQAEFAKRTGLVEYFSHFQKTRLKPTTSREHHFFDLTSIPISLYLEAMDKNAAAHSIEPRYPFLDRRVVEFCLALPPEQRIRNGYTRAIEREALAEYLPPEVRQRTSKGVADPYLKYCLIKFEGKNLKDLLFSNPDVIRSYIDLDFMHEAFHKLMAGSAVILMPLWRTVVLTFWLQEENQKKGEYQ